MSPRRLLLATSVLLCGGSSLAFTTPARPCAPPSASSASASTALSMASEGRRAFLNDFSKVAAGAVLAGGFARDASALDFDAFEKGEIATDTARCDPKLDPKCIPKLSDDEALCQYGGGGKARGEACKRVRQAGGKLPEVKKEKSLGGAYAM